MQIFVRGLGWTTYTIDIEPEDTVLTLKHRVQDRTGIRSTLQRLIFAGKQLEDKGPESLPHSSRRRNNTLADYKIRRESTVHLNLRMCHEVHVEWGVYGSMKNRFQSTPLLLSRESGASLRHPVPAPTPLLQHAPLLRHAGEGPSRHPVGLDVPPGLETCALRFAWIFSYSHVARRRRAPRRAAARRQNARTKPGHRRRAHSQASQNASTGPEQRRRARPQAPPVVK